MKKNIFKRFGALMLAVILALGLFPATSFAATVMPTLVTPIVENTYNVVNGINGTAGNYGYVYKQDYGTSGFTYANRSQIDIEGKWSVTVPDTNQYSMKPGDQIYAVETEDLNGSNPSAATPTYTVLPMAPTVDDIREGDTTITGETDGYVNTSSQVVATRSGTSISLPFAINPDGTFVITLNSGVTLVENDIIVIQITVNGVSNTTNKTVLAPLSAIPTVNDVYAHHTSVTGTGVPDATIFVINASILLNPPTVTAIVGTDGNWEASGLSFSAGDTLNIVQEEPGKSPSTPLVKTEVKLAQSVAPTINAITALQTSVQGSGMPGQQ